MKKILILLISILLSVMLLHAQKGEDERYLFNQQEDTYWGGIREVDTELVINYEKREFKLYFLEDENNSPKDKILEVKRPNKYLTILTIDSWGNGKFPPSEVKLYKSPDTEKTKLTMGAMVYSYIKRRK